MRVLFPVLLSALLSTHAGCVSGDGDVAPDRGVTGDAAHGDAVANDSDSPADAAGTDTSVPDANAVDATPVDTKIADTFVADADTVPGVDAGCKTTCRGNECGIIPTGCGGTIDCGDCGDPGVSCVVISPVHQSAVRASIEGVKTAHPEYFDFADALGESVRVLDTPSYRAAVVTGVNSANRVCIADMNDGREIRVRGATSNSAENYLTVTSAGYSAYKYTSTCTPALF